MKSFFLLLFAFGFTAIQAQDVIVTNDGDAIKAYCVEIGQNHIFYQIEKEPISSETAFCINKNQVLIIKFENGTKVDPNAESQTPSVSQISNNESETVEWITDEGDYPVIDINNYKGYLLSKGNCVYIPHDSEYDYERAGQNIIYKEIKKNGFWKVVNKPEQAHFVLLFFTKTSGRDKSGLFITTRNYYEKHKFEPEAGGLQNPEVLCVLFETSDTFTAINKELAHKGLEILKTKYPEIEKGKYRKYSTGINKFKQ